MIREKSEISQTGGKWDKKDSVFVIGLLALSVMAFLKCRYGLAVVDEAFFLSLGDKIYRGNAMLVHEWHASQFTFFLIQPLFALFHLFRKSNDGIVLFFRYAYVISQIVAASFLYYRTRKLSKTGAMTASWAFFLFCPLLQMNFNYNSVAVGCLCIALTILLTCEKHLFLQYGVAGLFFAGAVLCCPYLVFVYLLYSVIFLFRKKRKEWLSFSAGCAVLALVFFAFLLSRASFSALVSNAKHVLDDPEHPMFDPFSCLLKYFLDILNIAPLANILIVILLAIGLLFYLYPGLAKKKHLYVIFSTVLVIGLILEITILDAKAKIGRYPLNYVMFPVNLLAPVCVWASSDEKIKKIFKTLWVPGMLYSLCIAFISNLGITSICSAASVATVGSLIIIVMTFEKLILSKPEWNKKGTVLLAALLVLQIGSETFLRWVTVYPGAETATKTVEMGNGAEQGVYVAQHEKDNYEKMLAFVRPVREYEESRKVTYITYHYWMFLEDWDMQSCTPSNLLSGLHPYEENNPNTAVIERLDLYYFLNPDRVPDALFVGTGYDDVMNWYIDQYGYTIQEEGEYGTILTR